MIKKYLQFIKESKYQGFNSFGEWVESLVDDEYIDNIVLRYTKDIDPNIELSNALNTLDEKIQQEIKQQIDEYLQNGIKEKEPVISTSIDLEPLTESEVIQAQPQTQAEEITVAGKGVFTSFLKSLTGLGKKESEPDFENCPDNFLIYYHFPNLDAGIVKQIFTRFKSLSRYLHLIDYGKNEVDLYFGIRCDGQFEYGLHYDRRIPMGQFKLSAGVVKWIIQLDSKSAASLKKALVNLTYSDIVTLGRIKTDMAQFTPGYFEKRSKPILSDKILSFGFFGHGRWNSGQIDDMDFQKLKSIFTNWLLTKKWGSKVLISVKPSSFWVYLHVKLK